ncbi:MAG: tRNA (N(6)-L-threonylcarbamoyladenosine(37)-C(2))-methylthiotransferase MtaB [Clostridiales Family XIII bacterium]|jgi:threonylcarbamoyladenosine tRNA methylthiotransferase MtaB|nr:tRNA (N(6)-L-threonylcarbamoyladenosine(37)-C(2))-methylthiotransferase MtaB [Clostridiales Family XIII bacterium]
MVKKTFAIHTLGCKVNQQESEALSRRLTGAGFEQARGKADIYIVNSCTVTQTADAKTRQHIRAAKAENPGAFVCVIGCYPQVAPGALLAMPEVDLVLPGPEKERAAEILVERFGGGLPGGAAGAPAPAGSGRTRAFLKIEDGCDRFCAYCVIPLARGQVRMKPQDAVVAEASALLAEGYKEIVVTGINIGLYEGLYGLLGRLTGLAEGEYRIRLGSLEPTVIGAAEAARIAALPRICPHFHLSLQSGCARTLARMGRPYTPEGYMDILRALRGIDPLFGITTDVICGFPGETDEDFEESLAFVERAGFSHVHVFPYSKRPGTAAAAMPDQVPKAVKAARAARLREAAERSASAFHEANAGVSRRTLILSYNAQKGAWRGLTDNGLDILVPPGAGFAPNRLITAKIPLPTL